MIELNPREEEIIDYLLNTSSEENARKVEEQILYDNDYRKEVDAVEMVLIDKFLSQELSLNERKAFEATYMNLPELRKKIQKAQKFHRQFKTWRTHRMMEPGLIRHSVRSGLLVPGYVIGLVIFLAIVSLSFYLMGTYDNSLPLGKRGSISANNAIDYPD